MKKITLIFISLVIFHFSYGQKSDSLKTVITPTGDKETVINLDRQSAVEPSAEVKRLQGRLDSLAQRIKAIESKQTLGKKETYENNYNNFDKFVNLVKELDLTYDDISKDRLKAEAYNILADVNNPESNSLGFKFTDIVEQKASNLVKTNSGLTNGDKKLFGIKVINLVSTVSSIVTPVGLLNNVLSLMTGFTSEKMSNSLKDPINKKVLKQFKDSLEVYRIYYASIDQNSTKFFTSLNSFDVKYAQLHNRISTFKGNVSKNCNINFDGILTEQVNHLFKLPETGTVNYDTYNLKSEVVYMNNNLQELKELVTDLKNYYSDYNLIVVTHFNNNLTLINTAKGLPGNVEPKITELITKLTELRDGKIEADGKRKEGFSNQFSRRITNMGTYLGAIK